MDTKVILFPLPIIIIVFLFLLFYIRELKGLKKENDNLIKKYRDICSNIPAIIFRLQLGKYEEIKIKYISSSCEKIFGVCSKNIIEKPFLIFERVYERDLENYEIFLKKLVNSEENFQVTVKFIVNEKIKWFQFNLNLEKNNSEKIWDGIVLDVTNQREAEEEIKQLNKELKEVSMKLHRMSYLDSLTGMYNRRKIMQTGNTLMVKAKICGTPYFVAMMDVDDFKNINDTYGHILGDKVLLNISKTCIKNLKGKGKFGRLGGEEFIFIITEKDKEEVIAIMDKLRETISKNIMKTRRGNIKVTVSIGVASLKKQKETLEEIVEKADKALYLAKRNGKNRVISA